MIKEYSRPATLQEALNLLNRSDILALPLAGGTVLSHGAGDQPLSVVDLQDLPLAAIEREGNITKIGSLVKLQDLLEANISPSLSLAIHREAVPNLRNQASLGGSIISAGGRSILGCSLLAMDARLVWEPGSGEVSLGDWLLQRSIWPKSRLLTEIRIPTQVDLRWECVARSPADLPVVVIAAGVWPSGRVRIAAGGFGYAPILVFDGPEKSGAEAVVQNALQNAGDDFASGEYRSQAGQVIVKRLVG